MTLEKHNLINEFPEMRDRIHRLKTTDAHFARLFGEYDTVDHAIYRFECGAETASDEHMENLKKKRLALKDELYAMMQQAA